MELYDMIMMAIDVSSSSKENLIINIAIAVVMLLLGVIIGGIKYFNKRKDDVDSELTELLRAQQSEISNVRLAVSEEVKSINDTLSSGLASVHKDIGDLRGDMKAFKAISEEREKAEVQREKRLQTVERSQNQIVQKLLEYLDKKNI